MNTDKKKRYALKSFSNYPAEALRRRDIILCSLREKEPKFGFRPKGTLNVLLCAPAPLRETILFLEAVNAAGDAVFHKGLTKVEQISQLASGQF